MPGRQEAETPLSAEVNGEGGPDRFRFSFMTYNTLADTLVSS